MKIKSFTPAEKTQLTNLLTERRKVGSDLIKSLNNQLNLAISLELTQQQITQISDQIQSKLDQQSFWVKRIIQLILIGSRNYRCHSKHNLMALERKSAFRQTLIICRIYFTYVFILFVIGGLIFKFKESIKQRLSVINGEN